MKKMIFLLLSLSSLWAQSPFSEVIYDNNKAVKMTHTVTFNGLEVSQNVKIQVEKPCRDIIVELEALGLDRVSQTEDYEQFSKPNSPSTFLRYKYEGNHNVGMSQTIQVTYNMQYGVQMKTCAWVDTKVDNNPQPGISIPVYDPNAPSAQFFLICTRNADGTPKKTKVGETLLNGSTITLRNTSTGASLTNCKIYYKLHAPLKIVSTSKNANVNSYQQSDAHGDYWLIPELKKGEQHTISLSYSCNQAGDKKIDLEFVCNELQPIKKWCTTEWYEPKKVHNASLVFIDCVTDKKAFTFKKDDKHTIELTNTGEANLTNVLIMFVYPNYMRIVEAKADMPYTTSQTSSGKTVYNFGTLEPKKKITIFVTTQSAQGGEIPFRVQMKSDEGVKKRASCATKWIQLPPALHNSGYDSMDPLDKETEIDLNKLDDQKVTPTYIFGILNEGGSDATNLIATVSVDKTMMEIIGGTIEYGNKKLQYSSISNDDGKIYFPTVPTLTYGEKIIVKVQIKPLKKGDAVGQLEIKYDQFDKPIIKEEGTSIYD